MRHCNHGRFQQQVKFLRRQFLQDGELPFSNVLSEEIVKQALTAVKVVWNDRIFTPLVTLWVFINQVLSADHSCRAAVARLIAHRVSTGLSPCSSDTGAYCQARKRLPERFFSMVCCMVGRALEAKVKPEWLWKGRRVYMFDGTTVTMPDTPANRKAYPKLQSHKPGLGFPIARVGAITSLASGAIVNLGFARYAGKGQGETSLLRKLWNVIRPGEVLLADSLMANWAGIAMLKERGCELVSRLNKAKRSADFRKGTRIAKDDHIVRWPKPDYIRSLDWKTYKNLPDFVTVREIRVHVKQRGFRTRSFVIVTTLLDPKETTAEDLAKLYQARWNNELDLRSMKSTMQMNFLRCKTPALVRKEVWTHVLTYNLIRTVIAQTAFQNDLEPRSISFKGAIQTMEAFLPAIAIQGRSSSAIRQVLYEQLLAAIKTHLVANRPNRFEPRLIKSRRGKYDLLTVSRNEAKRQMLKRVKKN